jgi:hypothetical protein
MAIDFNDIINKIVSWIKTNGNREITGTQLREILIDVANNLTENVNQNKIPFFNEDGYFESGPDYDKTNHKLSVHQIRLELGVAMVNYIFNKGFHIGNKEQTLITKRYHDAFHKTTLFADISIISATQNPILIKKGDTIEGQAVSGDDIFLFINPTNKSINGLYIVGDESSSLHPDWDTNYNTSVVILNPLENSPVSYTIAKNKSVSVGSISSHEIGGYVKTVSQLTILNMI